MPNAKSTSTDLDTLQMALVGYQLEKQKIEAKIAELQAALKGKKVSVQASGDAPAAPKRILSPAARKRIAAAQKRRWAEHRKKKAALAKEQS